MRKALTPVTWNYRVLVTEEQGEKSYCIHEVHYNSKGVIVGWTVNPTTICSDTLEGLSWHLTRMHAAVSKPVLRIDYDPRGEGSDTLIEVLPDEPTEVLRVAKQLAKEAEPAVYSGTQLLDMASRQLAKEKRSE